MDNFSIMLLNSSTNNQGLVDLNVSNFYEFGYTFLLIFSLVLNLYFSLIYKICVFWMVFTFGPLHNNPVNFLIVIDESIKMICLFGQSLLVYAHLSGYTIHGMYGHFCQFLLYNSVAGVSLSFIGGTCIAFLRLLYIKHQGVLNHFGTLGMALILITLQLAYIFGICYGRTQKFQEFETNWRICFPTVEVEPKIGRRNVSMIIGSFFALTLIESVIYALIFSFILHHDLYMARLLPEHVILKRKRKNALDLIEHFAHFIVEMGQIVCWLISSSTFKKTFNHLALYLYVYQNGILALALIAINSTLKALARRWFLHHYASVIIQFWIVFTVATCIYVVIINS